MSGWRADADAAVITERICLDAVSQALGQVDSRDRFEAHHNSDDV